MKKILFAFISVSLMSLSSCIKDDLLQFTPDPVIEFDAAGINAATSPFTYKVLLRHPRFGRPETTSGTTADPLITRAMADPVIKLRVNLVGPHMSTAQNFTYKAITVTPASPNLLAASGTHYTTTGTFTIPANSSYGEVVVNILNPGASGNSREVHLELDGNGTIGASENYRRIALRIAQN
jgi:hypothetical protein